ncbi:hypothetical protein [Corynebacterium alimapuense]|uniref:Uncharacterized protein n=1 Tax=Corynebacterium alimapuense TaxID=1576874 RepID=A0A3M8KAC8_9CORY|nr:hypothetical protein [Corynebacterium alimapuense]RNE49819.1 hypothetical protein C5L39_00095 [Corynebacterium alimapuense]
MSDATSHENAQLSGINVNLPIVDVSGAPLPTASTLRGRRCVLIQLGKFIVSNLRLALMVFGGKKH